MRYIFFILLILSSHFLPAQVGMVLITGGEFVMGKDSDRGSDFSPAHHVRVNSFYMDKHEVTNAEYKKFCRETGYKFPEFWGQDKFRSGDGFLDHPVIGITWSDAVKYAQWAGKRLPTEAEWEYAARGGLNEKEFPNGNSWDKERKRNEPGKWENLIDPVEQHGSNGFGLFDMGGNVWEWVSDWYFHGYYQNSVSENPKGPETGTIKVIRSGSWHSGAMCKKVYYRKGLPGSWVDFAVGFRCVKDVN